MTWARRPVARGTGRRAHPTCGRTPGAVDRRERGRAMDTDPPAPEVRVRRPSGARHHRAGGPSTTRGHGSFPPAAVPPRLGDDRPRRNPDWRGACARPASGRGRWWALRGRSSASTWTSGERWTRSALLGSARGSCGASRARPRSRPNDVGAAVVEMRGSGRRARPHVRLDVRRRDRRARRRTIGTALRPEVRARCPLGGRHPRASGTLDDAAARLLPRSDVPPRLEEHR